MAGFNEQAFGAALLEAHVQGGIYGAALFMKREGVPFEVAYSILRLNGMLDPINEVYHEVSFMQHCTKCGTEFPVLLRMPFHLKAKTFAGIPCPKCKQSYTFVFNRED